MGLCIVAFQKRSAAIGDLGCNNRDLFTVLPISGARLEKPRLGL
ncbi:MAG: hypothetical protein ACJASV_003146 [Pseudorhodobacter sp.]|jgi:hypothetical protein